VGKWNNEEDYEIMIAEKKKVTTERRQENRYEMERNIFFLYEILEFNFNDNSGAKQT
jgi:hypothetical protein